MFDFAHSRNGREGKGRTHPCRPTKRPTKTCKGGATRLRVAAGKGTESEERRRGERTEEKEMPFFY